VLILGSSGTGKSALALQLMGLGLHLVADDRTCITARDGALVASCPEAISGLIEARGVGVLAAEPLPRAVVSVAVDLDVQEPERLPPRHSMRLLDVTLPLLHKVESDHFPAAIKQYLRGGRSA